MRFPGFEGEWEEKRLGKMAEFLKGKGISKTDIAKNGITECIRYGELYTHYNEVISEIISRTNIDVTDLVLSKTNDVIIPSSGESKLDIAKASCVLKSDVGLGGDLNIIRTTHNGIFLSYYLNNQKKKEIASLAQGNSVVHLYASQLAGLAIRLPSIEEQSKISTLLSLIGLRIEAQNKIIESLKTQMLGLQGKLFRQKIKLKNSTKKVFPSWKYKNGGDVFKNISNRSHSSDLPILAITQEQGAVPRELIDYQITVTERSIKSYKVVEIGDFIISLRSFQGGIEHSDYKGICSPAYIILRNKIEIAPDFYKYYFKTPDYIKELNKKLEGIRDGKMISYSYFSEIPIPVPIFEEQKGIASFLAKIDQKIQNERTILEQLEMQKKYLLQQIFV